MSMSLTEREPLAVRAAVVALLTTVVHVLAVRGIVDDNTEDAIAGVVDAIGLIVLLFLARPAVTSNAKVLARVTTSGDIVAGDAAVEATGNDVAAIGPSGDVLAQVVVRPELVE